MKIAVLGAGNTGVCAAADMALRGHNVTLIKTSRTLHEDNFRYLSENGGRVTVDEFGKISTAVISRLSRDIEDIRGCDIVMLCTVTSFHEELIKRIAPVLSGKQILLICPGYFSSAYVLKYISENVPVAETQSAFIDCRLTAPGKIKIGFRNVRNPVAVYPSRRKDEIFARLDGMGFPITRLSSVADAALNNPNMIVHTVGAVMSIPRIEREKENYCMYHEVFTPSVWKLLERLDGEKRAVLEKLGLHGIPYTEACKFRNSADLSVDGKEVFFRYAAMPELAKGPAAVESRYITEDVPQGLALLESLGSLTGIPTPVCSSLIELASAALGRDMRENGRTVERLGRDNLLKILADGEKLL